jgi:hypothetical protein
VVRPSAKIAGDSRVYKPTPESESPATCLEGRSPGDARDDVAAARELTVSCGPGGEVDLGYPRAQIIQAPDQRLAAGDRGLSPQAVQVIIPGVQDAEPCACRASYADSVNAVLPNSVPVRVIRYIVLPSARYRPSTTVAAVCGDGVGCDHLVAVMTIGVCLLVKCCP